MYSVSSYGRMVADRVRMATYEAALRATVRPGSVVVDLGAGTGVMACLAARMGARHVYAIEPSDAIQVARRVAAANGLAERITFLQAWSRDVELPERADVVVSDLRGVLPLLGTNLADLADARERFLAPGGTLIPLRDRVYAAPVEAPDTWSRSVPPTDDDAFGLKLEPARRAAAYGRYQVHLAGPELLSRPLEWGEVDYRGAPAEGLDAGLEWRVERDAEGHGIAAWFDGELAPGIGFSNAPDAPRVLYGQAFFPWPQPVALAVGDAVAVRLRARLAGNEWVWEWQTTVTAAAGEPRARFQQSTLRNALPSAERLRRGVAAYVPRPGADAEILREVLARMDGTSTVAEIAGQLAARFPERFPTAEAALGRVAQISREWSL
ncbi:MAG TPA: 50S ribosomal protein L11 methyltransferase [Longimicrobium sp.]|nr:50S ribosomal protein L11 methyltransferase [Longimicrobium sp.]